MHCVIVRLISPNAVELTRATGAPNLGKLLCPYFVRPVTAAPGGNTELEMRVRNEVTVVDFAVRLHRISVDVELFRVDPPGALPVEVLDASGLPSLFPPGDVAPETVGAPVHRPDVVAVPEGVRGKK